MDLLKVIVVLIVMSFLALKAKSAIEPQYFWLMQLGLLLLLFSSILDFADDFRALDNVFILGRNYPMHDFLEDQIGGTLGFILFSFPAIFWIARHTKNS